VLGLILLSQAGLSATNQTQEADDPSMSDPSRCNNIYQFSAPELITNKSVDFCHAYRGKVLIVVNTASRCAFTGQYEGLEALYRKYADRGLVVLGFPSNQFGGQEPGSAEEIQRFCRVTYGVQFPMFAKTAVRKGDADPLWTYLGDTSGTYPKWNFYKYLVNRQGEVVDVFTSIASPDSRRFQRALKTLLDEGSDGTGEPH